MVVKKLLTATAVANKIYLVRDQRVMLDSDLAEIYGVQTKALIQAMKRNKNRFPRDFMFQLTAKEWKSLRSQIVTSKMGRGGRRYSPYVFTEHGAVMLASVLNSDRAIEASIFVVRAFVRMREMLAVHKQFSRKLR
jgi:phage regulator Rha-like protein